MLNLSTAFEILDVSRQRKQTAAKTLFPELYQAWLARSDRGRTTDKPEKIEGALFWRIITGDAAAEYYQDALAYFGIDGAAEDAGELLQKRCETLCSGLSALIADRIDIYAERLQRWFESEVREVDGDRKRILWPLLQSLRMDPNTVRGEHTREHLLQLSAYYLILSLTAHKKGDLPAAAAAIRSHCERTGFSGKSLFQQAQDQMAADRSEQAERLLDEAWETERVSGQSDYALAQLKKVEMERSKSEAGRKKLLERYQGAINDACGEDARYPYALIERARETFLGRYFDRDPAQSIRDCGILLRSRSRQIQRVLGEAYWLLYQWMESGEQDALKLASELKLKDREEVLEKACEQDWGAAIALRSRQEERKSVSLVRALRSSRSLDCGIAFTNCRPEEEAAEILRRTLPANWELKTLDRQQLSVDLTQGRDLPLRYFLFSDNEEKNLKDALAVLQSIREDPELDPKQISVFLSGCEDRIAPLVDTAQEHMGERITPVMILDPDKNAAQQLLSRHPLFYPIRDAERIKSLGSKKTTGGETSRGFTLHFVITGASRCCEWLLREAFWMMTFREQDLVRIRSRITVIAADATELLDRICCSYPGMDAFRSRGEALDADESIVIEELNLSPDSPKYRKAVLDAFTEEHAACYFAVDAGSDLQNLEYAIHLRELFTREWIRRDTPRELELPVIAFHCEDSDVANLSRETVVLNEALGSAWYNHYRLIPFGMASERCSWQRAVENVQEQLSFCNHLQYYRLDMEGEGEASPESKYAAAWKDYYRRSYNRESSFEVALSIPYRLYNSHFDMVLNERGGKVWTGMMPERWDIQDPDAFWSEETRLRFAAAYDRAVRERAAKLEDYSGTVVASDELSEIAAWEHERWNRYMISRGWITATPEQTMAYRRAGNGRWQLYIGKMHPCIIPFRRLGALETALNADEDQNLDFTEVDMRNVRATGKLISLTWIRVAEHTREREI